MKNGVVQIGSKFVAYVNDVKVGTAHDHRGAERHYEKAMGTYVPRNGRAAPQFVTPVAIQEEQSRFHINKRFDFLKRTVKMVASGLAASAVITGKGGLGKSFGVMRALREAGLEDMTLITADEGTRIDRSKGFVVMKGFSTAKGLFRKMYENNGSVLVCDDMDSVLKDPVALNILKGALDSYDARIISWNSESFRSDDDLPRTFEFTGRIIFVSNLPESKIDQAIRSRSAVIDLSMTLEEVVDRMATMIREDEFLPEFHDDVKQSAIDFIRDNLKKMTDVNLRTLITVCRVCASDPQGDWKEHAEYLTTRNGY